MTVDEWVPKAKGTLSALIRVLERHAEWTKDPQQKTALESAAKIGQDTLDAAPR